MALSVQYLYQVRDQLSAVFNRMGQAAQRFDAGVTGVQQKLGTMESKLKNAGAGLANMQNALAALGAGAALRSAVNEMKGFNDELAGIGTLIPGQEDRLQSLQGTIGNVASSVGKDMSDIAQGTFMVISAFGDMEGQTEARLQAVARAAVAGRTSTEGALSLLSAVTKGYGDTSAEALTKASDLAFMTNVLGQTSFPELAASIGRVIPSAAALGVRQEELFASYAALTGVTGSTAEVSTQMAAIMTALMKPTTDMAKATEALGFESSIAMTQSLGLAGTLDALMQQTGGSEAEMAKLFGSAESLRALFALTGNQAGKFADAMIEMDKAAASMGETTNAAFNEMTSGVNEAGFNMDRFAVTMQQLKIEIGAIVAESLGPLLEKLGAFVKRMRESNPAVLRGVTYFLMFVTALGAVLVPLGLIISSIGSLVGVVKVVMGATKLWTAAQWLLNAALNANPIGLIVIGIAAAITATILIIKHWEYLTNLVQRMWDTFKGLAMFMSGPFSVMLTPIIMLVEITRSLVRNFSDIKAAFTDGGFLAGISAIGDAILNGVLAPVRSVLDLLAKLPGRVGDIAGSLSARISGREGALPGGAFAGEQRAPLLERLGIRGGAEATASAEVSVYREDGVGVTPFERRGRRGYNMEAGYAQ